jgi:DNA-binding transcriptional regulator YhcF (GntR family)
MEAQPQQIHAESYTFTCSAEWHLARLGSRYAAPVYSFALHLSKGSGRFYPSINSLAEYFDAHPRYIGKAIRKLEKARFFIELKREEGFPVSYRPVLHSEWRKSHPGCCLEKVQMPWQSEAVDSLVSRLHAASDGKLRLYSNFVRGLRNTGLSDDAIVAAFSEFYSVDSGPQLGRYARFMKALRDVAPVKDV